MAVTKRSGAKDASGKLAMRSPRAPSHERFLQDHRHNIGFKAIRDVPKTGVIWATERASKYGYFAGNEEWANFGQGMPQVDPIPNQPPRKETITFDVDHKEYAPTTGTKELRQKVADYYNELYRKDKDSKYTWENVCITPGGRAGITRVMSILGNVQVGYFLPDYTAYEQALSLFRRFVPIPLLHNEEILKKSTTEFREDVTGRGIGAVLLSNPSNPTGKFVDGPHLKELVDMSRENDVFMIMDEFYSHYMYCTDEEGKPCYGETVSSARYVNDVNEDPVVIINGLTKNWRLPGWRMCWVVGPKEIVEALGSAGSYLEGGANNPLQKEAIPLLDHDFVKKDILALQQHFRAKRDYIIPELEAMGIKVHHPEATFYLWCSLEDLPSPLNDGIHFFEEAIKEKVIFVPGVFFDINPGRLRQVHQSKFNKFIRISYGPPLEELKRGVEALKRVISKFQVGNKKRKERE
uniref:Aminotransferase class I/classII large domain-containing protein n=1 Tax=Palpitomonas bilix TaxID=652834 RepID=A0A7S3D789_9EUKA|mmetsp:Transcript_24631/g.62358  ORF Transcript_24631/g.62358 Transcript_24631/m.62358 type:complete len:465 (+) Transcript_24631:1-1395(+)